MVQIDKLEATRVLQFHQHLAGSFFGHRIVLGTATNCTNKVFHFFV